MTVSRLSLSVLSVAVLSALPLAVYAAGSVNVDGGNALTVSNVTIDRLQPVYTNWWPAASADGAGTELTLDNVSINISDNGGVAPGAGYHLGLIRASNGAKITGKNTVTVTDAYAGVTGNRYGVYLRNNSSAEFENLTVDMTLGANGLNGIRLEDGASLRVRGDLKVKADGASNVNTWGVCANGSSSVTVDGNVNVGVIGSYQNGHGLDGTFTLNGADNRITVKDADDRGLGWANGMKGSITLGGAGKTAVEVATNKATDQWQITGIWGSLKTDDAAPQAVTVKVTAPEHAVMAQPGWQREIAIGVQGLVSYSSTVISEKSTLGINVTGPSNDEFGMHGTNGITFYGNPTILGDTTVMSSSTGAIGLRKVYTGGTTLRGNLSVSASAGQALAVAKKLAIGDLALNVAPAEGKSAVLTGDAVIFASDTEAENARKATINMVLGAGSGLTGATGVRAGSAALTATDDTSVINLRLADGARWTVTEDSFLTNFQPLEGGTADFNSAAGDFKTVTVTGNYKGGGTLLMHTKLGDDASPTDRLIVKGNTSGTTKVSVNNAGGAGAATVNGIEIVTVEGASDGEFEKDGRIVAGAYEYDLKRGEGAAAGNWYLVSALKQQLPGDADVPRTPEGEVPVLRPEPAGYTSNLANANALFQMRLRDRVGEPQFIGENSSAAWARAIGAHNTFRMRDHEVRSSANRAGVQMGADVVRLDVADGMRLTAGLMGGWGQVRGDSHSVVTGYRATNRAEGWHGGIYGTLTAQGVTGVYADVWATFSRFDNRVKGEELQSESYRSQGLTASLETGYTFAGHEWTDADGKTAGWYVQPQAQVTYQGIRARTHTEANGTVVRGTGDGNIQTRLGMRLFARQQTADERAAARHIQPFAEVNWIHNTKRFGTELDGVRVSQNGTRDIGEFRVGVEGALSRTVHVWANAGLQKGSDRYTDFAGTAGLRWNF